MEARVMQGNSRVGPTALYTAQAWRAGGFTNAGLFDHPMGRVMYSLSSVGQRVFRPFLPPYMKDFHRYLRLRHHAFEARMERLAPDLIVEIAAGLSPRGLTYAQRWPEVSYVELDLPNMVAVKRARLKRVKLPVNYRLAETDILAQDFVERLPIKPNVHQKVVVITEGLTDYLSMAEKQRAWANVRALLSLAAPGSRYLFESWPAERVLPNTATGQAGLQGLSLLVGRQMGGNLFANHQGVADALNEAGFCLAVRQDLHSLAQGLGVDADRCPFLLYECAVG